MKFLTALIIAAFLAPSVALADAPAVSEKRPIPHLVPEGPIRPAVTPPTPTIYVIGTRWLENDSLKYKIQQRAIEGRPSSFSEYAVTPSSGTENMVKTGISQTVDCSRYGASDSGQIQCQVKTEVRGALPLLFPQPPQPPQPPQGASSPTRTEDYRQEWDQTFVLGNGEKVVFLLGKYQVEMTVRAF